MPEVPELRVSDQEREQAAAAIRQHYAEGRLDDAELDQRLEAVYAARTVADLAPLTADLPPLPPSAVEQRAELAARRRQLQRRMVQEAGGGLTPFAICTVIWVASGATGFFWPIFLLFALAPLLRNGWQLYGPSPELDSVEADLDQRARAKEREREQHAEYRARQARRHAAHRDRTADRRTRRRDR